MPGPEQLFAAALAANPAQPLVTYYDEATGERAELSARSAANWVAKTHYLLTDEIGVGPGDHAFLALPAHWLSVPIVLGCLSAGLTLTDDASYAALAVVTAQTALDATLVPDVLSVDPVAAARGAAGQALPGTTDLVAAARPQPDTWAGVRFAAAGTDQCLEGVTRDAAVEQARARAASLGWDTGARVLTARRWYAASDLIDTLFAPLAVLGSVVYVANTDDPAVLDRRAEQERATARL